MDIAVWRIFSLLRRVINLAVDTLTISGVLPKNLLGRGDQSSFIRTDQQSSVCGEKKKRTEKEKKGKKKEQQATEKGKKQMRQKEKKKINK